MPIAMPEINNITISSKPKVVFNVVSADFGDGYDQTVAKGLNSKKSNWTILWDGLNQTQFDTVVSVLDTCKGADYLVWTDFLTRTSLKFICQDYEPEQKSGVYGKYAISATLKQVYRL